MSHHVAGTWWAIERYDTERRTWALQWQAGPCWPRLFLTREEVREHLAEQRRTRPEWSDHAWLDKYWRQRPVKVEVVRI